MKILLVGFVHPASPTTHGTGKHVYMLAKLLKKYGHHVEIFTTLPPAFFKEKKEFLLGELEVEGIKFNCLARNGWSLYKSYFSPMQEVYEPNTQRAWLEFLKNKPNWDIIHFHQIMPYSLIEISKKMGYQVFITLHDLQYVDPMRHFHSLKKFLNNPYQDLTREDISAESYVEDYLLEAGWPLNEKIIKAFSKEMEERIEYGKYLLKEIGDKIISNLFSVGLYLYLYWEIPPEKINTVILYDKHTKPSQKNHKFLPPKKENKLILANLSYWTPWKGQHLLVEAIKYLHPYKNKFELRLYGEEKTWGEAYRDLILNTIKQNEFLSSHIKLMGRYSLNDIDKICSEIHLHIMPVSVRLHSLAHTVFVETFSRSIPNIHSTGEVIYLYDVLLEDSEKSQMHKKIAKLLKRRKYKNFINQKAIKNILSNKTKFKKMYNFLRENALYKTGNIQDLAKKIACYIENPTLLYDNYNIFKECFFTKENWFAHFQEDYEYLESVYGDHLGIKNKETKIFYYTEPQFSIQKRPKFFVKKKKSSKLKFAIKIGTPNRTIKHWGDIYYAQCILKALKKAGHDGEIHYHNEWNNADKDIDVVIHLRGLEVYKPKPYNINLMWLVSHPCLVTPEELENYDGILVASKMYTNILKRSLDVPVVYLPQATDPEHFRKIDNCEKIYDIVFIGNNYSGQAGRQVVKDILSTGYNFALWGKDWHGVIPSEFIMGDFITWEQLPAIYNKAKIVLNDHHPFMKMYGFINNRTFDVSACEVFLISDKVKDIESEIPIITYENRSNLKELISYYLEHPQERELKAKEARQIVIENHTFDHRIRQIIDFIEKIEPIKKDKAYRIPESFQSELRRFFEIINTYYALGNITIVKQMILQYKSFLEKQGAM